MARGYVTDSWGYGVILISRDWILRLVPLFSGRWGNCPKLCQKFDALIWQVVVTKQCNIRKQENILSKEGLSRYVMMKNMQVSLYRFLRNHGGCVGSEYQADYCLLWHITQ